MRAAARRREMVFVNGAPYRQVFSAGSLRPRTFFVSEERGEVRLCAPANVQLSRSHVEVAVRSAAIDMGSLWRDSPGETAGPRRSFARVDIPALLESHLWGGRGSGLRTPLPDRGLRHWLEQRCGPRLARRGLIIRRTRVHDRISRHFHSPDPHPAARRFLIEDCEVAHNNWRGAMGGFYGFAVAGVKIMTSRRLSPVSTSEPRQRLPRRMAGQGESKRARGGLRARWEPARAGTLD